MKRVFIVLASIIAVLVILYVLFQTFVFVIIGGSMRPTFYSYTYGYVNIFDREFARKEIVVFSLPHAPRVFYVGRIVGLPTEHVEIKAGEGDVYINGEKLDESEYWDSKAFASSPVSITLQKGEFFILGDHRNTAYDARDFGPVLLKSIRGEFTPVVVGPAGVE